MLPEFNAELWRRISPHLDHALGMTQDERASYLADLHTTDGEAASELGDLLSAHDAAAAEGFLESSPAPGLAAAPAAGQTLGPYRLVAEIGRGGMGDVWLAEREDGRFQRRVAIKFLNQALVGRGGEERFRREGRLLARLTHPHIAQLLDAGVTEGGQPYLVIEHVDGEPIDRYCDQRKHGIEPRLELFFDVLAAVSDAHSHLIVHRDLKPANVLVTADGRVKLLDFGIAKLVDDPEAATAEARLTRVGAWALTPEYAAPEQVTGAPISTATDIYALGVMLYELLSGRVAVSLPGHALLDLVRAVVESAPSPMSESPTMASERDKAAKIAVARGLTPDRLRARLAGDLETIVRKAMKKEPSERYESVASLADDLRRFLRHEPIAARPDSATYRARKFVRRHRIATSFACVALTAIAAGILGTVYQAGAARDERDYALRQLSRAEAVNDFNDFLLSDAAPLGRPLEVSELLGQAERIARRQSAGSVESRADLLIALGDQFRAMDEPDRARDVLEHARDLAAKSSDPSIRARSDCALAAALSKGDELTRGKTLVAQALASLPDDPRVTLDRIYCLKKASFIAREDGASDSAIARIMEARSLLAAYPYRSEVQDLSLLMDLAESYSDADRHADAIPAFEQAVAIMASLGRDQTQKAGTLYNNWGLSLDMSGRPREAEVAYRRALDLSRSDASNDAVSPMLLINYGRALRPLGRLEEAARIVDEGLALARERDFEVVVNQSLLLLTSIYRELGDAGRSAAALKEAETRLRHALPPDHPAFGSVLMEHALNARDAGRIDDALALIDRAYGIAEAARRRGASAGNPARVLIRRAEIREAAGLHAAAVADARLALATFDDLLPPGSLSRMQGDAYLALGRALVAQGQEQEGHEALRASLRHLDDALGSESPGSRAARALLEGRAG